MTSDRTTSSKPIEPATAASSREGDGAKSVRPLVSVIVPAYNEASIIEENLSRLCAYLESSGGGYRWELIIVNDGSSDQTGDLAEKFALGKDYVRVLHHKRNFGLGQTLQYGINESRGDYVITLDIDLTYSPSHIGALIENLTTSGAKIVAASPYMKGGKTLSVPWLRRTLSIWANRFLSVAARGHMSTLTGMVRGYDGRFIRSINLRSMGMEINPEVIYKGVLLGSRIEEIPAQLDWSGLQRDTSQRSSSIRIFRQVLSVILSGFLFRPVVFFILPGLLLIGLALYPTAWMFLHFFHFYFNDFAQISWLPTRASESIAAAYQLAPHTFFVAVGSWMLGIQLISLGILALQSKSYFEEIYHLGSSILRGNRLRNGESTLPTDHR